MGNPYSFSERVKRTRKEVEANTSERDTIASLQDSLGWAGSLLKGTRKDAESYVAEATKRHRQAKKQYDGALRKKNPKTRKASSL